MTFDLTSLKVTDGQRALAAYIRAETGKQVKPEQISLIDALRAEFRKDPKRVAEREAVAAAARQRKQETLDKTLAKARKLAESLGLDLSALDQPEVTDPEPTPVEVAASVTPIAKARAKRDAKVQEVAAAAPAVVIDAPAVDDDFDFDEEDGSPIDQTPEDTSAIDVVQAEDGWETDADADDDVEDF